MDLAGTPSGDLPAVLSTGAADARFVFISLSARDPDGRDADYIAWHSLDHRPEQYRLPGLRHAIRAVSTPACRAARSASLGDMDDVDHVMTYLMTGPEVIASFAALGAALDEGGRMAHRLPPVTHMTGALAGLAAAPRIVAGADVVPWRPCIGVYLVIEDGTVAPDPAIDVPGVAGTWWYDGVKAPAPFTCDGRGKIITLHFIDDDPVRVAGPLGERLRKRWHDHAITGLLAAPFVAIEPFAWGKHLP